VSALVFRKSCHTFFEKSCIPSTCGFALLLSKNKGKGKNGVCEVDWLFKTPLHFFENYEHQRYMLRASLYPRGRQTATMFQAGWRERNVSAQLYRRVSKIANENYMWLSGWFLKINMQQVDFSKTQCSTRMVRFLCIFAWQS
jgi:hypothetical protein